jgi:ribosome assembly protein RRB1
MTTEETKDDGKSTKKKGVTFGENTTTDIWDESKQPMKDGEEMVFDNSAYEMLHRAKVEWPCLSIDFLLRERVNKENHE